MAKKKSTVASDQIKLNLESATTENNSLKSTKNET